MVKTAEAPSGALSQRPGMRRTCLLTLLLAGACAGTSQPKESTAPVTPSTTASHGETSTGRVPSTTDSEGLRRACSALLAAQPGDWTAQLLETVANGGEQAAEMLREGLLDQASAPGAQAGIAVLGRIGDAQSIAFCRQLIQERATLATEAALALSHANIQATDDVLLACVRDRHADATLRTACACALAKAGNRAEAPELIEAIVRAGTAGGRADEQRLGLPGKPRWARERYFVQRLLRQLGHSDLLKQLDSDAPWQTLEDVAPRIRARLEQKRS